MVNQVRENRAAEDARRTQLVADHIDLAERYAWKIVKSANLQGLLTKEETLSLAHLAACVAAKYYDGSRGASFGTFMFYHIRGDVFAEATKKVKRQKNERPTAAADGYEDISDTYDSSLSSGQHTLSPGAHFERQELSSICREAMSELDQLEAAVIERHYFQGHSIVRIAEDLNYSRFHIHRKKRTALEHIRRFMERYDQCREPQNEYDPLPLIA